MLCEGTLKNAEKSTGVILGRTLSYLNQARNGLKILNKEDLSKDFFDIYPRVLTIPKSMFAADKPYTRRESFKL